MMNINSKIDWKDGLEINSKTLITFDKNIDSRQQILAKISTGNLFGIVPVDDFEINAAFVRKKLEINRFVCTALLPSGSIIQADESVEVPIPMLYGDKYYLTVSFDREQIAYTNDNVPLLRPKYKYLILTLEEIKQKVDLLPILKFKVDDGIFSIDENYIPPYLFASSSPRYGEFIQKYIDGLTILAEHQNLESLEAKQVLLRYVFVLQNIRADKRVRDLLDLLQEIEQAVYYYIVKPNTNSPINNLIGSEYDILERLQFVGDYILAASSILDKVVLEDKTIDMERLKREVKEELYEQLRDELYRKLVDEIKPMIEKDIYDNLYTVLTDYLNNDFRESLKQSLGDELYDRLSENLFVSLYDKLYEALYVPVEDEKKDFMPII